MDSGAVGSAQLKLNSLDDWSQFFKTLPVIDFSGGDSANITMATKTEVRQTALKRYLERNKGHAHGHGYGRRLWYNNKNKLAQSDVDNAATTSPTRQLSRQRSDKIQHLKKINKRYRRKLAQLRRLRQQCRSIQKGGDEVPMQVDLPAGGQ